MQLFLHHVALCAPLFLLVALGWGSVKIGLFTNEVTKALGRFTFRLLMPVMLFKLMSGFADMPPVDWRILIAFFASCTIIYAMGRSFFKHVFKTDAAATTVLAMAGIFGNNVQLGVPIVQVSLGNEAIPAISLIIIFNVLLLWTVAIASVEFGRTDGQRRQLAVCRCPHAARLQKPDCSGHFDRFGLELHRHQTA